MIEKDILKILDHPTHHAYLVLGNTESNFDKIRLALRKKISKGEIEIADVSSRTYESLNIDDARAIKEAQHTMPIGERRFVLISLESIQGEAQNSLLKLFEEAVHTLFIVCARHPSIFLPTLLSRFYVLELSNSTPFVSSEASDTDPRSAQVTARKTLVSDFLAGNIRDRLRLLEPIIKEKDKTLAENFLNELESVLHSEVAPSNEKMRSATATFEDIFAARRFLRSRSPSVKMILEHLCGAVPVLVASTK